MLRHNTATWVTMIRTKSLRSKDSKWVVTECLDIACMVGMYIGAARYKKLMLVDGFISSVAALAACKIEPKIKDYIIATHMSEEPGMELVLKELGEEAFFNMKMRLGEGTGAVLAYPIIDCAIEVINGMKTPTAVYELFL